MQPTIKPVTAVAAVILLMFISTTVFSQTDKFSVSINSLTTNFHYGKSNGSMEPYKKNFSGLQAGFSYQAAITPLFSVVPELYFAVKGGSLKNNNPLTGVKSVLRIHSLEMPVLARIHCGKFYVNAGPYVAYILGGRLKINDTTTETTTRVSFGNSSAGFKRWDFGFHGGAGYNFSLKQSMLTLDIRYGYGLVNISKDVDRYNRMLSISVRVSAPGKKTTKQKQG